MAIQLNDTVYFQGPDTGYEKNLTVFYGDEFIVDAIDVELNQDVSDNLEAYAIESGEDPEYARSVASKEVRRLRRLMEQFVGRQYRSEDAMWRTIVHALHQAGVDQVG